MKKYTFEFQTIVNGRGAETILVSAIADNEADAMIDARKQLGETEAVYTQKFKAEEYVEEPPVNDPPAEVPDFSESDESEKTQKPQSKSKDGKNK